MLERKREWEGDREKETESEVVERDREGDKERGERR